MDDASAELLRRLLNDLPGRPWFVCVTRRAHDGGFLAPEGVGTTIELAPLDPEVTTELFHLATADAPIPAHELRALVARSGGHPLFLRELVAAAGGGNRGEALPDSVEALIAARIDRLDPRDRNVLRRASVLGQCVLGRSPRRGGRTPARFGRSCLGAPARLHRPRTRRARPLRQRVGARQRVRRTVVPAATRTARQGGRCDRRRGRRQTARPTPSCSRCTTCTRSAYREAWTYARAAADAAAAIWASVEAAALYQRALEAGRRRT